MSGEYTTKVSYPYNGHTPSERKFDIRAYRAPRLKTQIKFLRDGYGPGEEVVAMTADAGKADWRPEGFFVGRGTGVPFRIGRGDAPRPAGEVS